MAGDDPASLIGRALADNPVLITRMVSMRAPGEDAPALVYATYMACLTHFRENPELVCSNPLATIIRTAGWVIQGLVQVPGEKRAPEKMAKLFITGRDAAERTYWRRVEKMVHEHVEDRLWTVATLLFHTNKTYDPRSPEWKDRVKHWGSLLDTSGVEVRKSIEAIEDQIAKGGRANVR